MLHVHIAAQTAASLQEMAMEVGSIAELRHPYVVPNHAGTRLLVNMDAESGPAIYLMDVASGTKTLLYLEDQKGYVYNHYKLPGWSPDDNFLAYGHQSEPRKELTNSVPGDLYIADGISGETLAKIRVADDLTNTLSQFAWLSTNSFAFLNGRQDLFVYKQKSSGWIQTRLFTNATGGNMFEAQSFTALSGNAVSWRMRGAIWRFDLDSGTAVNQWALITNNFNTNVLISSSFSPDAQKYLVVCNNRKDRQALYTFAPAERSLTKITRIRQGVTPDVPPTWINHDKGFAFLLPEMGMFSFMVVSNMYDPQILATNMLDTNATAKPVQLFKRGETRIFSIAGEHAFVAGVLSNEPPGIWDYNLASGTLRCVLSVATRGLEHVECPPFEFVLMTNAAGQRFSYHVWMPAHFSASEKYPLVIGNSPYSWTPFPLAVVNAGYYFVTVDRPSWTAPMDDWTEKLMTVYGALARNPTVDTNRVYLCARSMESAGATSLYSHNPQMWRGLIFFDPVAKLPDLSASNPPRVFIASGELEETNILQYVLAYQKKASIEGVPITVTILKGARHVSYGMAPQQQRVPKLAKFLSDD